ncbi:MAG: sensor histidine kinase [Chitinophagales bacterium]
MNSIIHITTLFLLQIPLEQIANLCTFASIFLVVCLLLQSVYFFKQKKKQNDLIKHKDSIIDEHQHTFLAQKKEIKALQEKLVSLQYEATEQKQVIIELKANEAKKVLEDKKNNENELLELLKTARTDLEKFVYIASHDLKEPLRMVTSFVELLKRRCMKDLDANAQNYIQYALDGVKRMDLLLNSLLQYSRIGRYYHDVDLVDLNDIGKKACTILDAEINENEAQIIWKNSLPCVRQSKTEMSQLFTNLIDNAVKFRNGHAPKIIITCKENERHHLLSIKDNGIGIDKQKDGSRIFDMFQQLHARTEYEGIGTGLAVCKKIIESNGGDIWFESEIGKGTTFYFTLPKNIKLTTKTKKNVLAKSK